MSNRGVERLRRNTPKGAINNSSASSSRGRAAPRSYRPLEPAANKGVTSSTSMNTGTASNTTGLPDWPVKRRVRPARTRLR